MNIIEALKLAKEKGKRVRPIQWRGTPQEGFWVEYRAGFFVEFGEGQEIPHQLRLGHVFEFLGEWEEVH